MVRDLIDVFVTVNEQGYLTGWSTSSNPLDSSEIKLTVTDDSVLFTIGAFSSIKLEEGSLTFDESKYLELQKLNTLDRLKYECQSDILKGFTYDGVFYSYGQQDQTLYQNISNKFTLLNTDEPVTVKGRDESGKVVAVSFNKLEFLTFFAYSLLLVDYKESLVLNYYKQLVNACTTKEELDAITFNSVPKEGYPLPEKPIIDLNGDGEISQEEFDALVRENKELKQKVAMNELALMDAINMLSSMITG